MEKYEALEFEIIAFESEDIITCSNPNGEIILPDLWSAASSTETLKGLPLKRGNPFLCLENLVVSVRYQLIPWIVLILISGVLSVM